jgi:phospholipase C
VVNSSRRRTKYAIASAAIAALATTTALIVGTSSSDALVAPRASVDAKTTTPIQHVVVIFDENISFDHYFATYPKAANTDGVTFTAAKGTPTANNLLTPTGSATNLLSPNNPNSLQPSRLSASQAVTCDQNHTYKAEQQALGTSGTANKYIESTNNNCTTSGLYGAPNLVLNYYDGNTVAAQWNLAQNFAMSDNSFSDNFGPSTPGALNLISGNTHGFIEVNSTTGTQVATPGTYTLASPNGSGVGTIINDPDPYYDDCADNSHTSTNTLAEAVAGQKNIGDLLNAKGVSWGWFQGGFAPSTAYAGTGTYAKCSGTTHTNVAGGSSVDYSPHHNPFAYYASTSNPHHLAPTNPSSMVGQPDVTANHNYDLSYFNDSLAQGYLPSVSFLKAPEYQDGHAAYSDPIDEQNFLIAEINAIQKSKFWANTAIVLAYDDSDGWYDHVTPVITNGSTDAANDSALCISGPVAIGGYADRCGPGTRQPLLVISPYSKTNYIDHTLTTQSSITKFIEDNWSTGRVGDNSFDASANSLGGLFNFKASNDKRVILKANGAVESVKPIVALKGATPKITGSAHVKHVLAVKVGTWTPKGSFTYSYQWYANGHKIAGATKAKLALTSKYSGKKVSVRVIGTVSSFSLTKASKPVTVKP